MNKIKVTKTEALILDAVKAVKNKGIKIKADGWYVVWNVDKRKWEPEQNSNGHCSCPLGAYLLAAQPKPSEDQEEYLADGSDTDLLCDIAGTALGKDREWAENFVANFDDDYDYGDDTGNEPKGVGSRSGRKLRKLLIK